jgi:hypothetical protein
MSYESKEFRPFFLSFRSFHHTLAPEKKVKAGIENLTESDLTLSGRYPRIPLLIALSEAQPPLYPTAPISTNEH